MKKIILMAFMALATLGAHAQFEKETHYLNASVSGFGIGFEKGEFSFGLSGEYGYFIKDNWMIGGLLGYTHSGGYNSLQIKPEFRYSFDSNGLNLGAGLQFEHAGTGRNYIQLCPQVGYTFFLGKNISLEPALYADFALNDFKNGTSAGLKIGIGLYK